MGVLGDFSVETTVEEKVSKWAVGGSVKLDLELEYTPLPSIEDEVDREAEKPGLHLQGQGKEHLSHTQKCRDTSRIPRITKLNL